MPGSPQSSGPHKWSEKSHESSPTNGNFTDTWPVDTDLHAPGSQRLSGGKGRAESPQPGSNLCESVFGMVNRGLRLPRSSLTEKNFCKAEPLAQPNGWSEKLHVNTEPGTQPTSLSENLMLQPEGSLLSASQWPSSGRRMEFMEADALMQGDHSQFRPRPTKGTVPWAVYIESACPSGTRRSEDDDRWRGSGGRIGSVTWPAQNPRLRRKYGSIRTANSSDSTLNFIEYSRIHAGRMTAGANEVLIFQAVPRHQRTKNSTGGFSSDVLSFQDAERLLCAEECAVSHLMARPAHLSAITEKAGNAIFFERKPTRRPAMTDRWNTSGGMQGSSKWPSEGPPRVRRRYGKIEERPTFEGAVKLCFVAYSLISSVPRVDGKQPDLAPRLYQVWSNTTNQRASLGRKRTADTALPWPQKSRMLAMAGTLALALVSVWCLTIMAATNGGANRHAGGQTPATKPIDSTEVCTGFTPRPYGRQPECGCSDSDDHFDKVDCQAAGCCWDVTESQCVDGMANSTGTSIPLNGDFNIRPYQTQMETMQLEMCISCMASSLRKMGLVAEDVCCQEHGETCHGQSAQHDHMRDWPAGETENRKVCMLSCEQFCAPSFHAWHWSVCTSLNVLQQWAYMNRATTDYNLSDPAPKCTFGDYYRCFEDYYHQNAAVDVPSCCTPSCTPYCCSPLCPVTDEAAMSVAPAAGSGLIAPDLCLFSFGQHHSPGQEQYVCPASMPTCVGYIGNTAVPIARGHCAGPVVQPRSPD